MMNKKSKSDLSLTGGSLDLDCILLGVLKVNAFWALACSIDQAERPDGSPVLPSLELGIEVEKGEREQVTIKVAPALSAWSPQLPHQG